MDNTSIGILGLVMGSFVFVIGWYVLILAACRMEISDSDLQ